MCPFGNIVCHDRYCAGAKMCKYETEDENDEIGFADCQHCGKAFDEIDREYQICSYCLYDSERKIFVKGKRKPQWSGDF